MLHLQENEKVILTIRKHWFVMFGPSTMFVFLYLVPLAALIILPYFTKKLEIDFIESVIYFSLSLYCMILLLLLFLVWTNYYLDMWILTDRRLIDIEQHSLFHREVAEIPLSKVQDVTIEVKGIIPTLLKFGTIKIQTAGERNFFIHNVPHLYRIKDIILKNTRPQDNKS